MKKYTHAWVACRAAALLEAAGDAPGLVELLKPHLHHAAIGAWIPDMNEMNQTGFTTQHHVFQIMPEDSQASRFICSRDELVDRMSGSPYVRRYLAEDAYANSILTAAWWDRAYRADPDSTKPGMHIPNRIMGMTTMLKDLIPIGDDEVQQFIQRDPDVLHDIDPEIRVKAKQLAYFLFMISHYITDACMPCHCDGRNYVSRSNHYGSIHQTMERLWENDIKDAFLPSLYDENATLLDAAVDVDARFGLAFSEPLKPLKSKRDAWLEGIDCCRSYFSVASVIAPEGEYPYIEGEDRDDLSFGDVFTDDSDLFAQVTRLSLCDAAHNTAMLWRDAWVQATT